MTQIRSASPLLQGDIPWGSRATRDKTLSHRIRFLSPGELLWAPNYRPGGVNAYAAAE